MKNAEGSSDGGLLGAEPPGQKAGLAPHEARRPSVAIVFIAVAASWSSLSKPLPAGDSLTLHQQFLSALKDPIRPLTCGYVSCKSGSGSK